MVDILNTIKDAADSAQNAYNEFKQAKYSNNRIDRVDQAKVIWYQWANELNTNAKSAFGLQNFIPGQAPLGADVGKLSEAVSYDISNHIEAVSYSKGMGNGSGSFSITLQNSFDWSRFMRPGTWILIFLSSKGDLSLPVEEGNLNTSSLDGVAEANKTSKIKSLGVNALQEATGISLTPVDELPLPSGPSSDEIKNYRNKLRVMGVISRVGIKSTVTVDGTVDVSYVVTGKDFGVVYEETELWFNANDASATALQQILKAATNYFNKNLTPLLQQWHEMFVNTKEAFSKAGADLSQFSSFFPEQWLLPDQLIDDLELPISPGKDGYFGNIANLTEFNATVFENADPNPLAGLEGTAWNRLKSLSEPAFHELFTELSDLGNPKIYFRPIPWAFDKSRYPNMGKTILSFKDLASGESITSPLPLGFNLSSPSFSDFSFSNLDSLQALKGKTLGDERQYHSVYTTAIQVDSFDVGPDWHSRYNFFLISNQKGAFIGQSPFAVLSKDAKSPFPMRNEDDIRRYGFKPKFAVVNSFFQSNSTALFGNSDNLYSNNSTTEFVLEANEVMRDYYANAEDYYSGTLTLFGLNEIKLGKVLVTDDTFDGISDMVFYIEGYTDNFTVNVDGTCVWTQMLNLTRGISTEVLGTQGLLEQKSTKDKAATKTGTFHSYNKNKDSPGPLKQAVDFISRKLK